MRLRFWIGLVVARACLATTIVPVHAALITYDSRALFDAAAPGLAIETFESGLVAPGAVATCSGPVSSAAASTCFPFGSLLPGVTYSAASGGSLVLIGSGFPPLGTTSKVFGPNLFTDTFDMRFVQTPAVGFDVLPGLAAGSVAISLFDLADLPLGSFTIAAPIGGTFFGAVSDAALIGRINVASGAAVPGELVDNVAFQTAQVPEPAIALLMALGLTSLGVLRRRKV